MRVVIVYDPVNPHLQETVQEVEDGIARIMIREGRARKAPDARTTVTTPGPGPAPMLAVRRRATVKETSNDGE